MPRRTDKFTSNHGGPRPGAGRKPGPNGKAKTRAMRLSDTAWRFLRAAGLALNPPTSRSGWIEHQAAAQKHLEKVFAQSSDID